MMRRAKLIVNTWADVPAFENEAAEREYWMSHEMSPSLVAKMKPVPLDGAGIAPPARPRTRPIPIRFDEPTLARLKALAVRQNRGYQTIAREFIAERLYEEEKREGII